MGRERRCIELIKVDLFVPSAQNFATKAPSHEDYFFEIKSKRTTMYSTLSEKEEFLGSQLIDAAYKVHKELGPGLLEKIYEACLCHELEK